MKTRERGTSLAVLAATLLAFAILVQGSQVQAASIDTGTSWDTMCTTPAANTAINWSALTWSGSAPSSTVTAGIDNNALARTYTVDTSIVLKQLQFTNCDAITLGGSGGNTITWNSGTPGVRCELGRNRGPATNYSAGRIFTINDTLAFVLENDLRVTNWVEGTRATTYNATTSGPGELWLRHVLWLSTSNTLNLGGSSANTHTGGTRITTNNTTNMTVNKNEAFGTGVLTLGTDAGGNADVRMNLNRYSHTIRGLRAASDTAGHIRNDHATLSVLTLNLHDGDLHDFRRPLQGNLALVVDKLAGSEGTGVQTLTGNSDYAGGTAVNGATLVADHDSALGTGAVSIGGGTLTIADTRTVTNAVTLNSGRLNVLGTFAGTLTANGGTVGGTGMIGTIFGVGPGVTVAPGASVGTLSGSGQTWLGGGSIEVEINDAAGQIGMPLGWDLLSLTSLNLTNLGGQSQPFQVKLVSLDGTAAGEAANFDPTQSYEWPFLTHQTLEGTFDAGAFAVNADAFLNDVQGGTFAVRQTQGGLAIAFTPGQSGDETIPEPVTMLLLGLAAGGLSGYVRRRRLRA